VRSWYTAHSQRLCLGRMDGWMGWDGMGGYLPCPALQATTRSKRSKEIMPSCCALESSPPHPTQPTTDGYKCPGRIRHATGRTRLPNPNRSTARHGDPAKPAITTPRRFHSKHKCRTTATARTHGRPVKPRRPPPPASIQVEALDVQPPTRLHNRVAAGPGGPPLLLPSV
jgi:hypothetical protein